MAMLEMLAKMVGPEKLLGEVAFTEFMHVRQVIGPGFPVRGVRKLLTAITAHVGCSSMGW